jgi:hypothetical protein
MVGVGFCQAVPTTAENVPGTGLEPACRQAGPYNLAVTGLLGIPFQPHF